jgi:hypothetical protein
VPNIVTYCRVETVAAALQNNVRTLSNHGHKATKCKVREKEGVKEE